MNLQETDRIKIELYNKFYEDNRKLYLKKPEEFIHEQRLYVEKEFRKRIYKLKPEEENGS